jgi:AraC-like DNA-binding protein
MQLTRFEVIHVTVAERWGKSRSREPSSTRLYWLVRGGAMLDACGHRVELASGDLALLPRADPHVISDGADSPTSSSLSPEMYRVDGHVYEGYPASRSPLVAAVGENATPRVWGMHRVDEHVYEAYPAGRSQLVVAVAEHATPCAWIEFLPAIVTLKANEQPRWIRDTLAALASVCTFPEGARAEVAQTLLRVLVAHAFDARTRAADSSRDAALMHVLSEVRSAPEAHWELGTLARHAGMSRSVFAERVVSMLGMSLGRYVRELRMDRARDLLSRTDMGIKQVGARVGYANDRTFARAFLRSIGESPADFRAHAR